MERQGGEEVGLQYQWFNTTAASNNSNPIVPSSYTLPENHLRRESASENHHIYWDPTSGNPIVFQNAMLPNNPYQNLTPSQNTNPNDHLFFPANSLQNSPCTNNLNINSTDFADQAQHHQLTAALNRLSISNHHQSGGATSNPRVNSSLGGNGFTAQYQSSHFIREEEEYLERLKNQYVLLMAEMDQYMRLHGSPVANHVTTSNHALPHRANFPLTDAGSTYTGASRVGSITSDQFGYGYNPMRPNNPVRNGVISSRGSRYANGSGRQRLSTSYSSSSLEQRGQVMTSNSVAKDGSRFSNGSVRQQHPTAFNLSLEELRGKIALVAKDHVGCRFLQKKVEEGKPEEVEMIFKEVMDADLRDLMVDQFGNEFIQKLVEATNKEGQSKMLDCVMSDEKKLKDICTDQHGSRAMQKLLERVETREQQSSFMRLLKRITIPLSKTQPGYYVIQVCLKHFSPESTKGILELVLENCLALAKDKFGCCLVQSSVHYAYTEAKERLVADITEHARVLSEDPYGNYVVQYIIGLKIPRVTADILAQLGGSFVNLSMNKYGSNVIEKSLKEAGEEHINRIINEMINSPNLLTLLQDPYGNYVAQSALGVSKGAAHNALVQLVRSHYPYLHSHLYGKRVLDKTRGHRHRC
ncbi:unnamed protein product [Prunus armeniaca]|uniref:PUM-HD domain-containing protein n=1 Tax=Prunus armeniaca TaxID=36596 RepID=A0A6J5Y676_PRUAR|nr:unnamed protein product [Prunus armeniaca]